MERPKSLPSELWDQLPESLRPGIVALITVLEARISELERQLGLNSTNSSKPPSSDGPNVKRPPAKAKSKNKRGGQPGHSKHQRAILPPTEIVDRKPAFCSGCGGGLAGKAMFLLWFRVRDGTLDRKQFRGEVQPIRLEIFKALSEGQFAGCPNTAACCESLFDNEEKMWTFLEHERVEPTNNAAERALRGAAIWRKLCFGTHSESGSRFVETALTVWQTCKLQGKNTYEYLQNAFQAATWRKQPQSLIPCIV